MRKLKVQSVKCKVIKEGFTLIEFLIAVAIITLLVGVILWPYAISATKNYWMVPPRK